jgi:hypothetical protein
MLVKLKSLQPGRPNLFVIHVGLDSPEMSALEDLNTFGPKEMSKHRNAELNGLMDPSFRQLLQDPKYRLINYRILIEEKGPGAMKRPLSD